MLPRWYPNIKDKADGNFIESHIEVISEGRKVIVLFVKGIDNFKGETLHIDSKDNLTVYKSYFRNYTGFPGRVLNVLRYVILQFVLYKRIKKEHGLPIVSHVHVMARSSILAYWLNKIYKVPFIVSEHWGGYYPESNKLSSFKKGIYAYILNKASVITSVSQSLAQTIRDIGVKNEVVIIPNVLSPVFLKTAFKEAPVERINILHVSNLIKDVKRVDVIIKVLEKLSAKYKEIYLTIVGDGPDRKDLEKLVSQQVLMKRRIRFTGDIDHEQIATLLQETHFTVLFSKFETQSIVLIESIAMGVPVVAPRVGGIPEHFDGKGILYECDSEIAFENAICQMIEKRLNYSKDVMRTYANSHFSKQGVKESFTDLYNSVTK